MTQVPGQAPNPLAHVLLNSKATVGVFVPVLLPEPEARTPLMSSVSQWQDRDSKPSLSTLSHVPLGIRGTTVISSEAAGNALLFPAYRWSN